MASRFSVLELTGRKEFVCVVFRVMQGFWASGLRV